METIRFKSQINKSIVTDIVQMVRTKNIIK